MNKKILLIIIAVFIVSIGSYLFFHKQSSLKMTGADMPNPEEQIRVLFPKGGEKLEMNKTYDIKWENYIGEEPLTISLQVTTPDEKIYLRNIAFGIPATTSTYSWSVGSEDPGMKYKIKIYPEGEYRPYYAGQSNAFFSIIGDALIMVDNPNPLEKITSPLKITGKAHKIFSEGEFIIKLREVVSKKIIASTRAMAQGDWLSGNWCDFSAELSFEIEKLKDRSAEIEFYQIDERDNYEDKLIYEFVVLGPQTLPGHGKFEIFSPAHGAEVTSPMIIEGKAREDIFYDGKFKVALWAQDYRSHPYDPSVAGKEVRLIKEMDVVSIDENCGFDFFKETPTTKFCSFKTAIEYTSSAPGKINNSLNFYQGGKKELGEGFIMSWPIKLK